ncbi:MAG: hypothetical protein NW224_21680 [Leptolyngbyaceae cyanobacterium bins.302]|nr:hypothetical protein [Leptolyngbyaceae cyanobacterium bins.302]
MGKPEATMGAIRVSVKLTNEIDEALVSRGSLAPRHLRTVEALGLVDTGALTLVIPPHRVEQLRLRIRGQQIARYANGYEEAIGVTEPVIVEVAGRSTVDEALVVGDEILIGQVILEKLDLLADCRNQQLIPNPANPDYPVAVIKALS